MNYRNKSNIICQNCGSKGHHYKRCPNPITSLGIVAYRINKKKEIEYLLVCRRNTIGFVEFIRGNYANSDIDYIQKLFNVMTNYEIELLKTSSFDILWEYLWMDQAFNKKRYNKLNNDYRSAISKFKNMSDGYCVSSKKISLMYFIDNKNNFYVEQEWGFPKGRRNYYETDLKAATREFLEETNINKKLININSEKCFTEIYKSYDNITYKNIYYIAEYIGDGNLGVDYTKQEQCTEISKIEFFNLSTILGKLRDYDTSKIKLIKSIDIFLTK